VSREQNTTSRKRHGERAIEKLEEKAVREGWSLTPAERGRILTRLVDQAVTGRPMARLMAAGIVVRADQTERRLTLAERRVVIEEKKASLGEARELSLADIAREVLEAGQKYQAEVGGES
jgi:hypothetical protein